MATRLRSLDAFRGLTIAAMLLVNNPGSWSFVYPPLEHAEWNGWTPTDLIFPFFLFIVGVALVYSFTRRREAGADRGALWRKIALRSLVIVLLGLLLNGFPYYHLSTIRIPGVLQRIGLVYLCTATAYLCLTRRGMISLTLILLLGYAGAMLLVPVPGYGAGVFEPVGNLAQYIDSRVLAGHMWKPEWDPEGLLSTVPAVATCLIGVLTGEWLRGTRPQGRVLSGMLVAGLVLLLAGLIAGRWLPINKSLWSSSYVLFTGGAALLTLALCYWLIDMRGWERWARAAYVFGANPLIVFVGSGVMARLLNLVRVTDGAGGVWSLQRWCYERLFASWAGPLNGSLAYAIAFVGLWWLLMWIPYRRRWSLRA
ncbi:MAG: heparan-alpha-glucosaminide N-acetyltransferase domain-containing protein [Gemmatimonadota bacterium]